MIDNARTCRYSAYRVYRISGYTIEKAMAEYISQFFLLSATLLFIISNHRRRNRGGHWGHVPPQPAGKGGSAPTARAMPIHAVLLRPDYEISYEISRISSCFS